MVKLLTIIIADLGKEKLATFLNKFLSDDTIAANIAFGVDTNDINQNAVENAAKIRFT